MRRRIAALWVLVVLAQLLASASAGPQLTLQAVRKNIVGMWNCTEAPCEGAVVTFDEEGRITQEGFLSEDGRVLGFESTSRYQLSVNPKGPGILIMRVIKDGKAFPMYLVETMDADNIAMRTLEGSPHFSSGSTSVVKWKRLKPKN
jgi:hypothetical protein